MADRRPDDTVVVGNLSPPFFEGILGNTKYCETSNWTLVGEWDTRQSDLSSIVSKYSTEGWSIGDHFGFAWHPDGTRLSLANSDDFIVTFDCSTAFDPDTASYNRDRQVELNPTCLHYVGGGVAALFLNTTGDEIDRVPSSDYAIGSGGSTSNLTKSDVGFAGSGDGSFTVDDDLTYMYWHGQTTTGDERLKYITFTSSSLDNFSVSGTSDSFDGGPGLLSATNAFQNLSTPNLDGDRFYMVRDGNAELIILDNGKGDLSAVTEGTITDLTTLLTYTWSPEGVWINPNDTTHVWVYGRGGAGLQLAKFATNCP